MGEEMKIYVVLYGCAYEGYDNEHVGLNFSKALEVADLLDHGDSVRLEVWDKGVQQEFFTRSRGQKEYEHYYVTHVGPVVGPGLVRP